MEELTEKVLHEARVFITPGFIFGSNGKRYIRISLCAKDEKLAEALERIKKIHVKKTKYQIMELDLKPIELPVVKRNAR